MAAFDVNINDALLYLDSAIEDLEKGFVRCENCGEQEDTKTLDCVSEIKSARDALLKFVDSAAMGGVTSAFIEANKSSPVVAGAWLDNNKRDIKRLQEKTFLRYTLEDGQTFDLPRKGVAEMNKKGIKTNWGFGDE